jgi:hypothetical protein
MILTWKKIIRHSNEPKPFECWTDWFTRLDHFIIKYFLCMKTVQLTRIGASNLNSLSFIYLTQKVGNQIFLELDVWYLDPLFHNLAHHPSTQTMTIIVDLRISFMRHLKYKDMVQFELKPLPFICFTSKLHLFKLINHL